MVATDRRNVRPLPRAPGRALRLCLALAMALGAAGCDSGEMPLHRYARTGDLHAAREAIRAGANVDIVDENGTTALLAAIAHGNVDVALEFIDRGADPNRAGRLDTRLLQQWVDIEIPAERLHLRPVMVAALLDDVRLVEALLNRGAVVVAATDNGMTALHLAALAGREEVVRLLIRYGARVDVVDDAGRKAADFAAVGGNEDLAEALRTMEARALSRPIEVGNHFALGTIHLGTPPDLRWRWSTMPVGIAVGPDGTVYWSHYRTGEIRARRPQESASVELARADGPLGVAYSASSGAVYFTADGSYPRSVNVLVPGSAPRDAIRGATLNRPFAIAAANGRLFWTETINGRIRTSGVDFGEVVNVVDDGIGSAYAPIGAVPMSPLGIAVDGDSGILFWSDVLGATISRAHLDGSERQTILSVEQGVEFPTGLAIDERNRFVYWADAGTRSVRRARYDGSDPEIVVDATDGLLEPYGVAVDAARGLLYWTDVGRDGIWRRALDGGAVEAFERFDRTTDEDAGDSRDDCVAQAAALGGDFVRSYVGHVRTCLVKVGAVHAVARFNHDSRRAGGLCRRRFAEVDVERKALVAALQRKCSPARARVQTQALLQLAAWVVAREQPHATHWLDEVRPHVASAGIGAGPGLGGALGALDDLRERLLALAPVPEDTVGATLVATGQRTPYSAITAESDPDLRQVPDDGTVRAGAPLAYVDNGDGTVTDVRTGLMWEKKCNGCGTLHDVANAFNWKENNASGENVATWLDAVNTEAGGGFAGHTDWRLPTLDELLSIVDYEQFNPAVSRAFDRPRCGLDCASIEDEECSCTRFDRYWTSTPSATSRSGEEELMVVTFNLGLTLGWPKTETAYVRAVRGAAPVVEPRWVDQGDGTILDRQTRLVWEKKIGCDGGAHDVGLRLPWSYYGDSPTVWDWLEELNAEGGHGFAGHADWRIPNIKELASLADPARSGRTIDPVFTRGDCCEIESPSCSATYPEMYWSSTTFADFPAHALAVHFSFGGIDDRLKTYPLSVRAVRGPVDEAGADPGAG